MARVPPNRKSFPWEADYRLASYVSSSFALLQKGVDHWIETGQKTGPLVLLFCVCLMGRQERMNVTFGSWLFKKYSSVGANSTLVLLSHRSHQFYLALWSWWTSTNCDNVWRRRTSFRLGRFQAAAGWGFQWGQGLINPHNGTVLFNIEYWFDTSL